MRSTAAGFDSLLKVMIVATIRASNTRIHARPARGECSQKKSRDHMRFTPLGGKQDNAGLHGFVFPSQNKDKVQGDPHQDIENGPDRTKYVVRWREPGFVERRIPFSHPGHRENADCGT